MRFVPIKRPPQQDIQASITFHAQLITFVIDEREKRVLSLGTVVLTIAFNSAPNRKGPFFRLPTDNDSDRCVGSGDLIRQRSRLTAYCLYV